MLDIISQNSLVVLYLLQATTYGAAAVCSQRKNHAALTHCYAASALIYSLFGACHVMHLG